MIEIDWEKRLREDGPAVWRAAHRALGNRADADEVFSETFAEAVRTSRARKEPVRSWRAVLIRLATARAVDRLRQRIRRNAREISGGDDVAGRVPDSRLDSRPEMRAEQAEMSARLRTALAHLPPKQADAFCLHALEGWSYREVADELGESVDHVGVLIHRARAELKQRIAFILSTGESAGAAAGTVGNPLKVSHEH